jgi:ABC-type polysaccharide/polyol phosphate transport system ATPase subunit
MGIFGSTGVRKSTVAKLICEIEYINNGRKIIDLQNNKYLEVCSFIGPTKNRRFISNLN